VSTKASARTGILCRTGNQTLSVSPTPARHPSPAAAGSTALTILLEQGDNRGDQGDGAGTGDAPGGQDRGPLDQARGVDRAQVRDRAGGDLAGDAAMIERERLVGMEVKWAGVGVGAAYTGMFLA